MTVPVICPGDITMTSAQQLHCTEDWHVYESDLLEFAHLLTFDLGLFGLLFGAAATLFLTGYSAGVVVRQFHRV